MKTGSVYSSAIKSGIRFVKFLCMGKKDTREYRQISTHGIDSCPIKDRILVFADTGEIGKSVVIGYINKEQIADVGEIRVYSTDADGVEKIYLHLKNNGTAEFNGDADNMMRYKPANDGFEELKRDLNTMISRWNAFATAYAPGGPSVVGTPPTAITVSPSAAAITNSKIAEIKTSG